MTDGGKSHETNKHEAGADDEGLATTEVLDDVETTEGSAEVDGTKDNLGEEVVGDTGTLHDGGSLFLC